MTSGTFDSVQIDRIFVDRNKRQRRELRNIDELALSIKSAGLIHPPVITREMELIAGERRWTACKQLGWTSIPVQWVDEVDPELLHLIELEENVKRNDLTWQEECDAIKRYHELRKQSDDGWTVESTADELGISRRVVFERIAVANEIEKGNEKVKEAPKYSVALGIVQRDTARRKASQLETIDEIEGNIGKVAAEQGIDPQMPYVIMDEASEVQKSSFPVPLKNEDFIDWAAQYSGPKFNLLHCDFPYGVNADKHDQGQAALAGGYADSWDVYKNLIDALEQSMSNVVAESAHLMFWFSMDYYEYTRQRLLSMGWKVNPFPLVWHKNDNTGILPDPNRGPRRIYETAFLASRGDRLIVRSVSNCFAWPGKDKSIHMSEKPRDMLTHFLRMLVDGHTYFLDPTCGSANAVAVAEILGAKRVLGLERDEEFYTRAKENFYGEDD